MREFSLIPAVRPVLRPAVRPSLTKGGGVEAEATALFARFTTAPTAPRKALINTLIKSLKSAGVWTKLDALYLFAAADAQAARRNWIQDLYNATAVSSPTFTADRGYAGDGAAAYLDTGFNPSTASSPKLTQNSGHASFWDTTARAADASVQLGALNTGVSSVYMQSRFTGNISAGFCSDITQLTGANTNNVGHYLVNRSASNAKQLYKNGASIGSNSVASAAPPNASVAILATSRQGSSVTSFSSDQIAAASLGQSLTSTEVAALYSAISTYLQAVGAA